jgi:hypothetical protein
MATVYYAVRLTRLAKQDLRYSVASPPHHLPQKRQRKLPFLLQPDEIKLLLSTLT